MRSGIATLRISAGFKSAATAALALKVSEIYLRNIERGATGASPKLVSRMAKTYRVSEARIILEIKQARNAFHGRMLSA